MRGNCGKARNHHALHWLVELIKTCNRQKGQHFEFSSDILWWGGECHLAAGSARQDAVALHSHWCSTKTRQDATDPAAWI